MGHLSNDEFFTRLVDLFDRRKGKDRGTILLTQKRLSHGQPISEATTDSQFPDLNPPKPLPVLIRATNTKGKEVRKEKKIKLSTIVEPDVLPAFFERYADVCKLGMTTLKPRDRSKRKGKARKKRAGGTTAVP